MRAVLLTAALAVALAGCAQGSPLDLTASRSTEDPARYLDLAGATALFDAQSAQLAVTRAQRTDVRAYAQELVDRRTASEGRLAGAATASGMTPPPAALTSAQRRMLADLERASAQSFDEVYLRQQLSAQQTAMRIHHAFALAGDAPLLRPVAASEVGMAYQHYQEARRLRRARTQG